MDESFAARRGLQVHEFSDSKSSRSVCANEATKRFVLSKPPVSLELAPPTVVAIDMGYGHLRPARAIASMLGCPVLHADEPPLADSEEQRRWATTRRVYETMSRISAAPWIGPPFRALLNAATAIPHLHPFRDLSARTSAVRLIESSARAGLGRSMVAHLQERNSALVTTFYSPALLADFTGTIAFTAW